MRQQNDLRDPSLEETTPVIVTKQRNRFIAANILDPIDGSVQFHIVSTKWFNIIVVFVVTLFLCGITVLGLLLYVKSTVDQNVREIEELKSVEGP